MDSSPPGSSTPGIFLTQGSNPVFWIVVRFFTVQATEDPIFSSSLIEKGREK